MTDVPKMDEDPRPLYQGGMTKFKLGLAAAAAAVLAFGVAACGQTAESSDEEDPVPPQD